jgi:hypothetical protein
MTPFSKDPAFNPVSEPSAISEVVFRLVAIRDHEWFPQGACTIVAGHLAITAAHVVEDFLRKWGTAEQSGPSGVAAFDLKALQILNEPVRYSLWDVRQCFICPFTDIALRYLMPYCETAATYAQKGSWKQLAMDVLPPPCGSRIVGFGFHSSEARLSKNPDGTDHIDLNDKPTATVGEVCEIHPEKRDSVKLNFPCYQVNARFDGGMSGGPVLNDSGQLCGVICDSFRFADPNEQHVSYVATLWPAMGTILNVNREKVFPRDVFYPMWELAREGSIAAVNWQRVEVTPAADANAPGGIAYIPRLH